MDGSTIPLPALGLEALPHHVTALRRLARQTLAARYAYVDPDDVVQDVIVRVVRRWPLLRFADDRALAGYLQRAVINRARDVRDRVTSVVQRNGHSAESAELESSARAKSDTSRSNHKSESRSASART